ncbi:SH3 domain-containing protein [Floridanema evergladense]|uniref:SH3 domain-containing protein n=1 Tax=Floridaenema evergladense BLCC-F167 TaxID=3153639 RepID=A0ABV4WFP9_9CYAN
MEINKLWKQSVTTIALLTVAILGTIALTSDACTKTTRVSQRSHRLVRKTTLKKTTVRKIANRPRSPQATVKTTCAKVVAENKSNENVVYKLNVRSRIYGPVVEQLDDDTTVTVIRRFPNGWVQISSPVQGYVFGEFLKGCQ